MVWGEGYHVALTADLGSVLLLLISKVVPQQLIDDFADRHEADVRFGRQHLAGNGALPVDFLKDLHHILKFDVFLCDKLHNGFPRFFSVYSLS